MHEMGPRLLDGQQLWVYYGSTTALEGLSFSLEGGSFTGLIGPNGAGKTTLLLVLSGQFRPRSGIVRFKGQDIYERNLETKREIGYVHEEPFLYPHLTAEEHLTCIARMKKIRPAESGRQIPDLLDAFGLIEVRRKLTARLSLGMRKKLALASAMLGDPQILFLDEALSGLDVEGLHRVKTTLKEFTERGGTVLLSSHNLDLMEKLCGRYALLRRGRLIADLDRRAIQSDLESRVLALLAEFPNAIDFKGPD